MPGEMTVKANSVASEIEQRLRAMPKRDSSNLRALRRAFSKQLKDAPPALVLDIARALLRRDSWPQRFIAYELVANHKPTLASLREKELTELAHGFDTWEAVDTFGCYLSGPAWRENQLSDRVIHRWAKSPDRWWRRAALVSTVALNGKSLGGEGDAVRTFGVCALLVDDRDDMVVKAMSWALRKLGDWNPDAVRKFLSDHEDRLAPRVLREVRNKLVTGLKSPRKATRA